MGRKLNQKDHKASIYFRLRDEDNWLIMDKLMLFPEYEKNRAKLLNDALTIGLPQLLKEKVNLKKITLLKEPKESIAVSGSTIPNSYESDNKEIRHLLSEIVINTSLNKSMLSGLFNLKENEIVNSTLKQRFSEGLFNNIPNCLFDTEIDMLKEVGKDEEE